MERFHCPHLNSEVEFTDERMDHIASRHPELMPEHRLLFKQVLENPDRIRSSTRFSDARMFSKFFNNLRGGKHVVVVVVSDRSADRHWIITAYITSRIIE